jgi:outer membrane protein TolC
MKKMIRALRISLFVIATLQSASGQTILESFDDVRKLAETNATLYRNNSIDDTEAKRAKLAAALGILDPTGSASLSYTNNTRLPVSIFPAEIVGGQPGTFEQVTLGIQYVNQFNANLDVKLLNLQGWEQYRLSRINRELVRTENSLEVRSLQEQLASVFYNILTLQEQLKSANEFLGTADSLFNITDLRYRQGLVGVPDLNAARISKLEQEENVRQITFHLQKQYQALKILCDVPASDSISVRERAGDGELTEDIAARNTLQYSYASLQEAQLRATYRAARFAFFPTLSVFASGTSQQFSTRSGVFRSDEDWIPSSYIGLRLSVPIPSSAMLGSYYRARFNHQRAQNNARHVSIEDQLAHQGLATEYAKAVSLFRTKETIFELRSANYQKKLKNYEAGFVSIEETTDALKEMISSRYDVISSRINALLIQTKLRIYHEVR